MQDYVGWIISAVVLGMAAWPILHMVPSTVQKRQIAFRIKAQGLGIQVKLQRPELPQELKSQYHNLNTAVAYFLPEYDSKLKGSFVAMKSNNQATEWFWLDRSPEAKWMNKMLPSYQQLPSYILAIEQSQAGTSLYWNERGEIESIDDVFAALKQCNQLLQCAP